MRKRVRSQNEYEERNIESRSTSDNIEYSGYQFNDTPSLGRHPNMEIAHYEHTQPLENIGASEKDTGGSRTKGHWMDGKERMELLGKGFWVDIELIFDEKFKGWNLGRKENLIEILWFGENLGMDGYWKGWTTMGLGKGNWGLGWAFYIWVDIGKNGC
ncbi:hypothetical protein JTB14_003531 [Gonioctena quinquepunctata]|nr:hypothetical protein JTB14_003531 [Gonioctena quinquepunctata]